MGAFRFLLALFVVVGHLSGGWGDRAGIVAVFCFYVISGYLITRILDETYDQTLRGMGAFAVNRVLRLYPAYWTVALLGVCIVLWLPVEAVRLNPALALPRETDAILANIVVFGITPPGLDPYMMPVRLVPPSWSLSIELWYYLVLALFVARRPRWVAGWWLVSLAAAGWLLATDRIGQAYYTLWGPSLCFATGAALHHLGAAAWGRRFGGRRLGDGIRAAVFAIPVAVGFSWNVFAFEFKFLNLYMAIPATAVAVAFLAEGWRAAWLKRLDRFLGHMAYPVFLCHWHAAVLASAAFLDGAVPSPRLLAVSLPLVLLLSALLALMVERPVQRLRDRIRPLGRDGAPGTAAPLAYSHPVA